MKARAGSSSMMISVSSLTCASPGATTTPCWFCAMLLAWVTSLSSLIRTVNDPCVTTEGVTRTSPPMTIVPVRELTITLAAGRAGSTSIFSSRLTKDTFCAGSIGARTLIVEASRGTATSGPNTSFTASATRMAVLKSDW